jgi:hypothetical protein
MKLNVSNAEEPVLLAKTTVQEMLHDELDIPTLQERRKELRLSFLFKIAGDWSQQ